MSGGMEWAADREYEQAAEEKAKRDRLQADKIGVDVNKYGLIKQVEFIFNQHKANLPHKYVTDMEGVLKKLLDRT